MGTSRSLAILAAVVAAATSAPGQSDDAGRYRTRGDSYRNDSGSGSSSGSPSSSRGGSSSAAAASAIVNNVPGANSSGFSGNLGSTANTASGRTGAAAGGLQSVTGTGRAGGTGAGAARPGAVAPGGPPATNGVNASNLGAPGAKGAGGPPKAGGGALFGMAGQIKVVSKGFAESTKTRKIDYDPVAAAKAPGTIVLNARKYVSPDDGEAAVGTDNRKAGLVQPL